MNTSVLSEERPRPYAGDLCAIDAWALLRSEPDTVLVDCRTDAEWRYVGAPDLSGIGKRTVFVPWQRYPDMAVNGDFVAEVKAAGVRPAQTVLLICRSGARSAAAAARLTASGFATCLNVSDGFEGGADFRGHRGRIEGWKAAGLPWQQS